MKSQSALILGDSAAGLVAGLHWQFVAGSDTRTHIHEIRRQANELGVRACVRLGRAHHAYAGYDAWDPAISPEKRPARLFSFAALLSHRLHASDAILVWRIAQGTYTGLYAVVVLEDHLPVTDQVMSLTEAIRLVLRYRQTPEHAASASFWSNDLDNFPDAQPLLLDWSDLKPGRHERIRPLPRDPVGIAGGVMALALLVSGLLVASEYAGYRERITQTDNRAQMAQQQAYDKALQAVQSRLGADAGSVVRLMETWMDEPAIMANWSLTDVTCDLQHCLQNWQSEGGYTDALIKSLKDQPAHTPQTQWQDPRRLQVRTAWQLPESGVSTWSDLPDEASLTRLLFDEQQVWAAARVVHRVDLQGEIWPAGHQPAQGQPVLKRHAVTLTAPAHLLRHVLQDYAGLAWWNRLQLQVRPFDPKQVLQVELQGAFYAY